ncbi:EF-hand calcium-binding domain-containing protein 1, partial [Gonapodya sp. JEL0774]
FVRTMSVFLKGKVEEKVKFCFRVYDLNGDRFISKDEMYQMLKNSLVRAIDEDEDGVKELVEIALKKLDEDHDGRVSDADWSSAVAKEGLLMEAFGKCLPAEKVGCAGGDGGGLRGRGDVNILGGYGGVAHWLWWRVRRGE